MSEEGLTVNPSVLEWARKTAGLSIPEVASALKVNADFILALESRPRAIGKTTLRRLAQIYDRPLSVLFLPSPPTEERIPTDYRVLPSTRQQIGPQTAMALREAKRLQEALSDLKEYNPTILPSFQPVDATVRDKPNHIASQIRRIMKVDSGEQQRWVDAAYAFRRWRGKLQSIGIIVVVEDIPREEARGFSLWHPDLIPTIVVSGNEAPAAQIFTLFHELTHIVLRSDAMCLKEENTTLLGTIEAWCNKVAAAVLVPDSDLRNFLMTRSATITKEWPANDLSQMAHRFKVSRHVIAIRLEDLGFAPKGYYGRMKGLLDSDDHAIVRTRKPKEGAELKRNIPVERLAEVGFAPTNAILQACRSSNLSTMEAADLLRVRPSNFGKLLQLASFQSERYG